MTDPPRSGPDLRALFALFPPADDVPELELVPGTIEHDGFARGINVRQKAVEFCDIISTQVVARSDLDHLPISVGLGTLCFRARQGRRRARLFRGR